MKTVKRKMNLILMVLLTSSGTFTLSSCDNEETVVIVISEERAAEIVAASLAYNTYGMAANVHYVSNEISQLLDCDEQGSNSGTINYISPFGGVTSSFHFTESYSRTCSPEEIINYTTAAFQDIDAVLFTSQQEVNAEFTVKGLEDTAPDELYSGAYSRNGNWYSKVYHDRLDIEYAMNFDSLRVDKNSLLIVSGTSAFDLTVGYSETPGSVNFNGHVTFLSEDEAQIDFTNGSSYLLNLRTGEIHLI